MNSGVTIALMGIDGCGKTSTAIRLRAELAEAGLDVVDPGLNSVLAGTDLPGGYPRISLEQMALEAWRLFYAGCSVNGQPAEDAIPRALADAGLDELGSLLPAEPIGVRQPGIVVSAMLEFAGHYLLRAETTQAALERGAVCVSDGFPLKNVVRALRLAQRMPEPVVPAPTIDALARAVHDCYGEAFMQPDIGILLDADPALTYEWRVAQTGRADPGEDLGFAGQTGRESYVGFQSDMAREYREAAERWGWQILPVDGRPQAETIADALKIVLDHPQVQKLLSS